MRKWCTRQKSARKFCAAFAAFALAACATASRQVATLPPLESEAELFLQLGRFPARARGLKLEIESVSVVEAGGLRIPLTLRHAAVSGTDSVTERLLAWSRLPPGQYSAIVIQLRRGELAPSPARPAITLASAEIRLDHAFHAERGQATVLSLQLRPPQDESTPVEFEVSVPAKVVPQLLGWCSSSARHDVTVFDKRALNVSEILPAGREPWGIVLDEIQNRGYVALSGEDAIAVFDLQSGAKLARIRLGVGDAPRDLVMTRDRRMLISANAGSNTVSIVDAASMLEVDRVRVGQEPTWLLLDRSGARVFVFDARSNTVDIVDLNTRALVGTIATEDRPVRGQLDRAGTRLYVAQPRTAYLTVYSVPDLTLQRRVYVGLGASAIKVDSITDLIYVAHRDENRLAVYDPFSFIPVDMVELPDSPAFMTIDDAHNRLLALMPETSAIAVMELNSRSIAGVIDVGDDSRVVAVIGERY